MAHLIIRMGHPKLLRTQNSEFDLFKAKIIFSRDFISFSDKYCNNKVIAGKQYIN